MLGQVIHWILNMLAQPEIGLGAVFLVSFVSATLLPLGSEPIVFATIKANPSSFGMVILVATIGNTLGGAVDYWMGYAAKQAFSKERQTRWFGWLQRFGPPTMLMAWLPGIGDPICTLAGWLRMPFAPSVTYMAIGKCARYLAISWLLMGVPDGFWHRVAEWLG